MAGLAVAALGLLVLVQRAARRRLEAELAALRASAAALARRQEELLEVQRLEAVGLLAGGIAHEFNNLLTGILGNVSLARSFLPEEGEVAEVLRHAEAATLRAAGLTRELLALGRPYQAKALAEVLERVLAAGPAGPAGPPH